MSQDPHHKWGGQGGEWTQGWGRAAATSRSLKESAIFGLGEHKKHERGERDLHRCSPSYGVTTKLLPGGQRIILPWGQGNRSPGINLGAGKQEEQAAFPIAVAASLQHLPRKHMELISHVPGAPALSSSDKQEMTAIVPAARIPLTHSCPVSKACQTEEHTHPNCSPHPSLKTSILSADCSKGSKWPVTNASSQVCPSTPSYQLSPAASTAQPALPAGDGKTWKGRAATESRDAP